MKRTKNINLNRFRKVHTFWKYSALFLAISGASLFLTGCDDKESVSVYKTVQECEYSAKTQELKNRCALDYQNALANSSQQAPKYNSKADCEEEFGQGQCNSASTTASNVQTTNGSHSSFMWFPLMHGFSSSSQNYPSQSLYSSSNRSSPMYNKFVDAKGNSFGSFSHSGSTSVSRSALSPKPAVTTTTTRGGFGSTVSSHAARASVSSSHSSSSHSYGG